MVVVIRCSYWFRSRVNSFLWRFHHTLVIPSSDVVQSRVTRTSAPRLVLAASRRFRTFAHRERGWPARNSEPTGNTVNSNTEPV